MSGNQALAAPFTLGPLSLANRVVMAPMTRNRAGPGNVPHALNAEYYRQRASAGLIVTEATQVSPHGLGYPGTPGIHDAAQIAGWSAVCEAVHRDGGRIVLQLWHVGRVSHSSLLPGGDLPVAPSAIANEGATFTGDGMKDYETPRALETAEIGDIVGQFRDGAANALAAGFDGVEIHGGNGYLLDQFTRDGTNRRGDRYGGPLENRIRFPLEVTEAVIGVWGAARVGYRASPYQRFNAMSDSDPEATFTSLAMALAGLGVGYLHVIETDAPGDAAEQASAHAFLAARHPLFARLREIFPGPEVGGSLIVNSGYDGTRGAAVLEAGAADLVAYAKLFLANPDLPRRLAEAAPLNEPDKATFYGGDGAGYTDYPSLAD
jgi:N-ethylmaleimide reductase